MSALLPGRRVGRCTVRFVGIALGLWLVAGCVTDRSDERVSAGPVCNAAAQLVDPLIASGGEPDDDPALAAALGTLETAGRDEENATTAADLSAQLAEVGTARPDSLSAAELGAWHSALDDLDERIDNRCGFSLRMLIATSVDPEGRGSGGLIDGMAPAALGSASGAPLDWHEIQRRLAAATWIRRGYEGVVGTEPGVFVTVWGVRTDAEAMIVCTDVVAAVRLDSPTDPVVEIHDGDDNVLAASFGEGCSADRPAITGG